MLRASLILAATLALTGCRRDAFVDDTLHSSDALSRAMVRSIEEADDRRAGVAAAQALLDARRPALEKDIAEIKALKGLRISDEVRLRIAPELVEDLERVEQLREELRLETAADPELDRGLRRLVREYGAMLMVRKRLE